jgi:hypothetical protein
MGRIRTAYVRSTQFAEGRGEWSRSELHYSRSSIHKLVECHLVDASLRKLPRKERRHTAMYRYPQEKTTPLLEEPIGTVASRPSLLHNLLVRYRTRRLERRRQEEARQLERGRQKEARQLALRVEDVFIGCGLSQFSFSVSGSRDIRAPQVVSVVDGPPVWVDILILPGQMPDHFAKHASTIAYNLGVTEVRVVPLGPSRIRLELFP